MRATLPRRARSMLPWALDRLVPMAAALLALPSSRWTFRLAARTALASPDPNVEGRQGVSALSGSVRPAAGRSRRNDPRAIAVAPASPEGAASAATTSGLDVDASGSSPRGGPTASVSTPEGAGRRRHRNASPKRLVRDPALAPKSGVRWFELVLGILPRSPAYVMPRPLAAHAHARRRARLRATRAHPEECCAVPRRNLPEGASRGASRGFTRRWTLGGSWLRLVSSKLEGRLGPDSHRVHWDGRDSIRRRSLSPDPEIGMTGAEAPWVRSVRTSHLGWGSSASTEVLAPGRTVIHPRQLRPESALRPFPSAPKRVRRPRPVRPGRAVIRTCRWSRQRTFPKTRPSR